MSSTPTDESVEEIAGGRGDPAGNRSPLRGVPAQAPTQRTRGTTAIRTLAVHYRLRCLALEATVDSLETQLRRTERQLDDVVTRYEELLEERNRQENRDSVVFTATGL
jgi:hypothetical protein